MTCAETRLPAPRDIRVKKTPNCWHPYRATAKGFGTYGWGNTSAEAREKLLANIRVEIAERQSGSN